MLAINQREMRRTIKILENSVELSSKETNVKSIETSYKKKIKKKCGIEDYSI